LVCAAHRLRLKDAHGKLTVRSIAINATAEERKTFFEGFKNMEQGFTGTWNQLDEYLASAKKESNA
jgi:hypothetical protein